MGGGVKISLFILKKGGGVKIALSCLKGRGLVGVGGERKGGDQTPCAPPRYIGQLLEISGVYTCMLADTLHRGITS